MLEWNVNSAGLEALAGGGHGDFNYLLPPTG